MRKTRMPASWSVVRSAGFSLYQYGLKAALQARSSRVGFHSAKEGAGTLKASLKVAP